MNRQTRVLSIFNALIVLFIAGAAFTLSFDAIRSLAEANGIKHSLSWLVPLVVDGAMLSFSISVLRASLANERQVWGWALIVFFVVTSVVFNIAHSNGRPLGMALAALAPLALLTTFETLMSQIKSAMRGGINHLAVKWRRRSVLLLSLAKDWRRQAAINHQRLVSLAADNDKLQGQVDSLREQLGKVKAERDEYKRRIGRDAVALDKLPPRLADYVTAVSQGTTPDGDYSERWGVGVSTVKRANSMLLSD